MATSVGILAQFIDVRYHLTLLLREPLGAAEIEDWKRIEYEIHVEEDGPVYESLQRNKLSPVTEDGGLLSPAWESTVQVFYRRWAAALGVM